MGGKTHRMLSASQHTLRDTIIQYIFSSWKLQKIAATSHLTLPAFSSRCKLELPTIADQRHSQFQFSEQLCVPPLFGKKLLCCWIFTYTWAPVYHGLVRTVSIVLTKTILSWQTIQLLLQQVEVRSKGTDKAPLTPCNSLQTHTHTSNLAWFIKQKKGTNM